MRTATSLAHDRRGSGEPLVLIHGLGHRRQAWDPVIPLLTKDFEVIAIDLPGFGESPTPTADHVFDMPTTTGCLHDFFQHIGLDRPHVAGNSLGGAIALELGERDLVRSVTAIAPAGFWTPRQRRYAIAVLSSLRSGAGLSDRLLRGLARSPRLRAQTLRLLYAHPDRITAEVFLADSRSIRAGTAFDPTVRTGLVYDCLARPVVPTTIAWGDRDRILRPSQGRAAILRLPTAQYVELAGCGHIPMNDDPERVAAVIRLGALSSA
jgi:pimeloyl-ACP methyl ester carboxylesterase